MLSQVFISYRRENEDHIERVRWLAETLKSRGLPVCFDEYFLEMNPGGPDEKWSRWCIKQAKQSACVLMVGSPGYFAAFDPQSGYEAPEDGQGAAAEANVIEQQLSRSKYVARRHRVVLLSPEDELLLPLEMSGWRRFHPREQSADLDDLVRWCNQELSRVAARVAFLAEGAADLQHHRQYLKNILERDLEWTVLPRTRYPDEPAEARRRLQEDLSRSAVFIQLLGADPGMRNGFDVVQHEAAISQPNLKRIRFRSADLKPEVIEHLRATQPAYHEFITKDVKVFGFDDFTRELKRDLAELAYRLEKPTMEGPATHVVTSSRTQAVPEPTPSSEESPPLIRVVIRSRKPEELWEQLAMWMYDQEKLSPEQLQESESFTVKQGVKRCQGFMVVCDDSALEEGHGRLKNYITQVVEIQDDEKKRSGCQPPFGLVFYPPPSNPAWTRLLRLFPAKLHRIIGSSPSDFATFFNEVRKVPR